MSKAKNGIKIQGLIINLFCIISQCLVFWSQAEPSTNSNYSNLTFTILLSQSEQRRMRWANQFSRSSRTPVTTKKWTRKDERAKFILFLSKPIAFLTFTLFLACEQALLFGRVKQVSRERASERRAAPSLAHSRKAHFAYPNRRACSQTVLVSISSSLGSGSIGPESHMLNNKTKA